MRLWRRPAAARVGAFKAPHARRERPGPAPFDMY